MDGCLRFILRHVWWSPKRQGIHPGAAFYLRSGLHKPDPKKFWTILPSIFLHYRFTWIDKANISPLSVLRFVFPIST